jgi:AcrR family transcriptional regulator
MASASPRRSDALRNRARLIEAAKRIYAADGSAGPEAVAQEAGVGVGTLYRHFPDREALAMAVYEDELELVAASAAQLLTDHPPRDALRRWMDRFAERLADKRAMGDAMRAIVDAGAVTADATRARLAEAVQEILDAGAATGDLRPGVRADDLVAVLVGICLATAAPAQQDQAARMMDLVLAGVAVPDARSPR